MTALARSLAFVARSLCWFAMGALAILMMGVTAVDVILRWFGSGIPGAYEIVTLGMRLLIPLTFPYVFWTGSNVSVELIKERLPQRLRAGLSHVSAALCAMVMVCLSYAVILRAVSVAQAGEVTTDLGLPQIYSWVPLIIGCVLSVPITLFLIVANAPAERSKPITD